LILYSLRLLLGPEFTVRRVPTREQKNSREHVPDLRIFYRSRFLAEVEVTGTDIAWRRMILKGWIFVLPSKADYAMKRGAQYIYVFFNDAEYPDGEWLLWLHGHDLARHADLARSLGQVWRNKTIHGVEETYLMIPKRAFNTGLRSLVHYLKYLAGLVPDPRPTALVNFMVG